MNLVLIGYRGTGKSTIGALLAGRLKMRYVSTDAEIVKRAGMSTPEIVERYGWKRFRDLESEVTRDLTRLDNLIIDTGGGVIERPENVRELQDHGRVFWLTATVDTIVARIRTGTERPALTPGKTFTDEVAEVLEKRTPVYRSVAHYAVGTDGATPQHVAEEIAELWAQDRDVPAVSSCLRTRPARRQGC
jgi:shikimate kinase